MSNGEPRRLPAASHAERALTLGALLAILAGFAEAGTWLGTGASPESFAYSSFVPSGAFVPGVAVRALGAFLAVIIGVGFGLPIVALVSALSATTARFRPARRVIFAVAFLCALIGAIGYGAMSWH